MTEEEFQKFLKTDDGERFTKEAFVILLNAHNEKIFKSGGMALPHFNSFEELKEFGELIKNNKFTKPAYSHFSEILSAQKIQFDIPEKYKQQE